MPDLYSVAICFPENIKSAVREMKESLAKRAGRFPNQNADVHITFNVFTADANQLFADEKDLENFCKGVSPFTIRLTHTAYFKDNGTCYLAPDEGSKRILIDLMNRFNKIARVQLLNKPNPHATLARKLKEQQMEIARELFEGKQFNIVYCCDSLTIRKFNPAIGQYEEYEHFKFGGDEQLLLF